MMRASTTTRAVLLVLGLLSLACFAPLSANRGRSWALPLTAQEAPLTFPAIAATAQNMGLKADQTTSGVTVIDREGNQMQWAVVGQQYSLYLLPTKEDAPEDAYRALKVQADEIWRLALEARQQANVGAAVIVNQPSQQAQQPQQYGAPPPPQPGGTAPPAPQPQQATRQCTFNSDCGSGYRCQFNKCISDGGGRLGQGAECTFASDCGPGMTCRFSKCYSDGTAPASSGSQCTFNSDCGPGRSCTFGQCR